jgi:hypothetical protein
MVLKINFVTNINSFPSHLQTSAERQWYQHEVKTFEVTKTY